MKHKIRIKILSIFLTLLNIFSCTKQEEKGMDNILKVSFPLKGIYISPNTPGTKIPSHGTDSFGETYAIDFVMIKDNDKLRKPYRKSLFEYLINGLDLDDFFGWGQTVYSPVSGEVLEVENDIEERNPVHILNDYKNTIKVTQEFIDTGASAKIITGNYVMIKISENKYALLAHLKKGSINVVVGQKIKVHDIIGELGHSGNSTMPHLHMQFMNSKDYKVAKGLPFVFESYEVKQGNRWIKIYNSVPRKQDIIRYEVE
jgi:hypothetical protein